MFTTIYEERIGKKRYFIADAASGDDKPTADVLNGSIISEIDTKKTYKFNQDTTQWVEQ
ncbi:MAG: hypothetical protein J5940_01215 [Clostridia bacterium]|nr:hypothetical protein [Clostridia bacterium]